MSPRTSRLTRAAAVAVAVTLGTALPGAAPAEAASRTTHRLGPVRAAAAASATASLAGYVLRAVDVERPGVPLPSTTTWDRNRKREAVTGTRFALDGDGLVTVRYVVTGRGLYERDPEINGPALRLLGEPSTAWVFSPGPSFVGDRAPATHAARVLRDLSPGASVTTATRKRTAKGVAYTYVDTYDGVRSRITVVVRHGRVVSAFVRDAATPAGIEDSVQDVRFSFRYGHRHVYLPRPVVASARVDLAQQELGFRQAFARIATNTRLRADGGEVTSVATLRAAVRAEVDELNALDTDDPVVTVADVTDGITFSVVLPVSGSTLTTTLLWQGGLVVG